MLATNRTDFGRHLGLFVSGPLHFGNYGGLPLKIIWTLFTLLTLGLAVGGVYLTVVRLRGRRATGSMPTAEDSPEDRMRVEEPAGTGTP